MRAMVEEEKNIEALQQALELFNVHAERLRGTHDALKARVQELTSEVQTLRTRLENILASISDGVAALDASMNVTALNPAAAAFGVTEGAKLAAAFPGADEVLRQAVENALAGRATSALEVEVSQRGHKKILSFSAAPLLGRDGTEAGAVVSFRDVTEMRKLKADLERRERLAELGEMAAAIAHEIRNPLGGLRLFAGLARNALERGDAISSQKHFSAIASGIDEIDVTIENVLTFARDMEVRIAPANLRTLADEAIADLNGLFVEAGVYVENRIPENVMLKVDGRLLRRAMANLVDNAVKVQNAGGAVEIWYETIGTGEDGKLCVVVADRGPGVTEEQAAECFLPFRTGRAEGTGLGLTIVERVAEAHGGSAELKPRPGGGAVARIILPLGLLVREGA
ncbi:MAG TPA: PAS domain S-box protein [Planctomycetes bacterium]|nr:PAS domain S-box protein [Planctomycetota bacterium]